MDYFLNTYLYNVFSYKNENGTFDNIISSVTSNPDNGTVNVSFTWDAENASDNLYIKLRRSVDNGLRYETVTTDNDLPIISLNPKELKTAWKAEKTEDGKFIVTGEKIEKFARRTDLNNYASVNRLRDIMKKLGIRGELTSMGAEPDSIISIAGKEFTFVEDY